MSPVSTEDSAHSSESETKTCSHDEGLTAFNIFKSLFVKTSRTSSRSELAREGPQDTIAGYETQGASFNEDRRTLQWADFSAILPQWNCGLDNIDERQMSVLKESFAHPKVN